jgi:hypothetical protein
MSLIDEALKRARQEASRQDAAAREARYARVPSYVPPVRRPRSWLLPGIVAACLVVGAAVGVLISRSPRQVADHKPSSGPLPLAPSPARPPAPSPSGRGGTPAEVVELEKPALPKAVAEKRLEEKPVAEKPVLAKPVERPVIEAPVLAPAPAPLPPTSPPPAPVGPVVDLPQPPPPETRSYVREVPLDGGAVLRLNGIAFSAKPVALFDDKVLAPGESVGGFTVVEIEAKRVKLQGPGGAGVYVSLR